MIYYATNKPRWPVAREDEGRLTLTFGKHQGATLAEVPDNYLAWMVTGGGMLPAEVIEAAQDEIRERAASRRHEACDDLVVPDLRCGEAVQAWAEDAPAGDVVELASFLRRLQGHLEAILDHRVDRLARERWGL